MGDEVFIQRSRFGRSIYCLKKDSLEITASAFGKSSQVDIPLKSISSDYSVHARQMLQLLIGPAVLIAIGFGLANFIAGLGVVPGAFVFYGFGIAGVGVFYAIKGLRRVVYFNFYNHWKKPLFSVVREQEQAEICDDFVAKLIDRIERVEKGIATEKLIAIPSPARKSIALSIEDEEPKNYWKWAFVAAAVGITYPPVEAFFDNEGSFGLLVVLAGATSATAASLASFSKKEPQKYWSLIGAALSFLPFAIY